MKRILCLSVIAAILLSLIPITAGAETYGDLSYSKSGGGAVGAIWITITGCNKNAVSADIPAEIDGLPVTRIGVGAFDGCTSLTSVTIPNSIERIDDNAFKDCSALTEVTIPNSVEYIGNNAFRSCSSLTGIIIPNGVTSIGDYVFKNCTNLTSVHISDTVTYVYKTFSGCGSLDIIVDNDNPNYCDVDGVLFNKDKTEIIAYAKDKIQPKYTIPNGVTGICGYAFNECSNLTEVNIPNGVTYIGVGAFEGCESLTSVDMPNSITDIYVDAFRDCKSLMKINIPNSVHSIGDNVFFDTAYYNDERNWQNGVLYIDNCLIDAKDDELSSSYTINNETRVIADSAFLNCYGLTSVTIPDGVISIGESAFSWCYSLTSITIPNSVTSIGSYAFLATAYYNDKRNWQNGVLYIDNCLIVANDDELSSSYTINNGTRVIADNAFYWCDNLTSITIPNSIISIGNNAFERCVALTSIAIPNNTVNIGDEVFLACHSLNIIVDNGNPNYCDIDGVLFNKDKTEIIAYAKDKIQPEYTMPSGVTSIGDSAFEYCVNLTSVTIPNGVTSIGERAFLYCDSLTSITISESVINIGDSAFYCCSSLTDIYYGGSEADWEKIIIEKYNEALTNAIIHYNNEGLPRIEAPEPVVEGGTIIINAETKNIDGDNELFAVGYGEDMVTSAEKLQNGTANLPSEGVNTIKIFCWDSLDTMHPMCKPKIINID